MMPRRRFAGIAGAVLLSAAVVYAALALDAAARAREAFREADRYTRWFLNPDQKRDDLAGVFQGDLDRLALEKESGRWKEAAYTLELDVLRSKFAAATSESPAKRAFQWYRDVYVLYSPPETIYSRRARLLAPAFREAWREESRIKRLPLSDLYWESEPGISAAERVVYSARRRREAEAALRILAGRGVNARISQDVRGRGAGDGFRIVVPAAIFWEAHHGLREGLNLAVPTIVLNLS